MRFALVEQFVPVHFARLSRGILACRIRARRAESSLINVQCSVPGRSGRPAAYLAWPWVTDTIWDHADVCLLSADTGAAEESGLQRPND